MNRKIVLDPWGTTIIEEYDRLYEEFGIQPFKTMLPQIPNPSTFMRRGVIFGHRDFELVLSAIKENKRFAVMSGIKPTGEFHLGALMTALEIIYFQRQGGTAFYCIADIEAYEDNKIPFKRSKEIAVGNVADLLALGFDEKKGIIYRQFKEERVKNLAIIFGRGVTLATMRAIYGERHIGLYLSALIQAGDILMPQLEDFDGPKPTVVPVGADQDAHLRFTRDLAAKFHSEYGFVLPSSTYHKILKGLDGSPKMSKRNPMSYFTLQEKPEVIEKKLLNAFTGGRATINEQREQGGIPEVCSIYEICLAMFVEKDEDVVALYRECKAGELLCGECKNRAMGLILRFVKDHQRKKIKYIDRARELLNDNLTLTLKDK